jgi:hypothetical protein
MVEQNRFRKDFAHIVAAIVKARKLLKTKNLARVAKRASVRGIQSAIISHAWSSSSRSDDLR